MNRIQQIEVGKRVLREPHKQSLEVEIKCGSDPLQLFTNVGSFAVKNEVSRRSLLYWDPTPDRLPDSLLSYRNLKAFSDTSEGEIWERSP